MSTNLEIEYKRDLVKEEYEKLISNFDASKIYKQTNYYLDDKNHSISKSKCGLRIRKINDEIELTLKVDKKEGKLEINQQIPNISIKSFIFPDGEVKQYLETKLGIKIKNIYPLGKLITNRLDIEFKSSLISIDKSEYNGITDYEIECEDNSMEIASCNLNEFLDKYQIKSQSSTGSKLKRFLKTLY